MPKKVDISGRCWGRTNWSAPKLTTHGLMPPVPKPIRIRPRNEIALENYECKEEKGKKGKFAVLMHFFSTTTDGCNLTAEDYLEFLRVLPGWLQWTRSPGQ